MTYNQVLSVFGSQAGIARALGIQQPSVWAWAHTGVVPLLRQYQIEQITGGALRASDPIRPPRSLRRAA